MQRFRLSGWSSWLVAASALIVAVEAVVGFPTWARDLVRAVELIEGVAVVLLAGLIARFYARNYLQDPGAARLLPRHVVRLGVGVIGLTVCICASLINVLGEEFVWVISSLAFPSLTILVFGLWDMVVWLPHRTAPPEAMASIGHNEDVL